MKAAAGALEAARCVQARIMQKPGSAGQAVLAKMGGDDRREREDRTISRGIKAKKSAAGAHAVADHAAAAKAGDTFSIVGLFQEMDTDFSGTISTNELRKLINLVRKKSGKPILGVEKMLAKLDDDGDGEVTLTEWQENVPAAFLKVLQMLQKEDLVMSHTNTRNYTKTTPHLPPGEQDYIVVLMARTFIQNMIGILIQYQKRIASLRCYKSMYRMTILIRRK